MYFFNGKLNNIHCQKQRTIAYTPDLSHQTALENQCRASVLTECKATSDPRGMATVAAEEPHRQSDKKKGMYGNKAQVRDSLFRNEMTGMCQW